MQVQNIIRWEGHNPLACLLEYQRAFSQSLVLAVATLELKENLNYLQ